MYRDPARLVCRCGSFNIVREDKNQHELTIRHTIMTSTFFSFENNFPPEVRNVRDRITSVLHPLFTGVMFACALLCWATRLMRHQYLGNTHTLGLHAQDVFGNCFGQHYMKNSRGLHKNYFLHLTSNNFVTRSKSFSDRRVP